MIDSLADKSYPEEQLRNADKSLGGQHCHLHPPLRGPGSPWWVQREEISIQPLQYLQSIFIVNTASLTNNSNPGSDDEPGLRLVIAPAIKAQQNAENTGVHQISQLHRNQEKLKLDLEKYPILLCFC